jgi:hypothetical protein
MLVQQDASLLYDRLCYLPFDAGFFAQLPCTLNQLVELRGHIFKAMPQRYAIKRDGLLPTAG